MKGTLTINTGDTGITVTAALTFTNDWADQNVIEKVIDNMLSYKPKEAKDGEANE